MIYGLQLIDFPMVHKYSPIPYIRNCIETREDELYPLLMKISRQHSLNNFFYYQSLFSQTLTNPPKLLKRQIYKFLKKGPQLELHFKIRDHQLPKLRNVTPLNTRVNTDRLKSSFMNRCIFYFYLGLLLFVLSTIT